MPNRAGILGGRSLQATERLYLITITVEFKISPWRCLVFM